MPYVVATVMFSFCLQWIIIGINSKRDFVNDVERLINNLLLLTSAIADENMNPTTTPGHIWYLSSMMISMPLVCCLLQSKNRVQYVYYFSWLGFLLLYGRLGFLPRGVWPRDIFRAFVCMSLGVFIYAISVHMEEKFLKATVRTKVFLTISEFTALLFPVILTFYASENYWLIMLCFMVGLSCMLSGVTYSAGLQSKFLNWLGKFSLFLYLAHFPVVAVTNIICPSDNMSWEIRVAIYIVNSICTALAMYGAGRVYYKMKKYKERKDVK